MPSGQQMSSEVDAVTMAHKVRGGEGFSLRVVGEGIVELFALPKVGDVVIGRGQEADVRIDDASISRKHALLSLGMRARIKDLGSQNGTRIGDRTVEAGEWADVSPGEVIDLGSVMLILMRGAAEEPAPGSSVVDDGAMARASRLLERVAPGDISVLIQGETGVGKEVFAER